MVPTVFYLLLEHDWCWRSKFLTVKTKYPNNCAGLIQHSVYTCIIYIYTIYYIYALTYVCFHGSDDGDLIPGQTNWRDQQFQTCWKRPGAFWCGRHTSPWQSDFSLLEKKGRWIGCLCGGFNFFLIFTPIWGRCPIWLIFFRRVETTNQLCFLLLESESVKQTQHIFLNPPWSSTASLPLKRHQSPKGKDRLPVPSFFQGLLIFRGVSSEILGDKIPNLKFFRIDQNTKSSQDLKELVSENFTHNDLSKSWKVIAEEEFGNILDKMLAQVLLEKCPNVCPGAVFFFFELSLDGNGLSGKLTECDVAWSSYTFFWGMGTSQEGFSSSHMTDIRFMGMLTLQLKVCLAYHLGVWGIGWNGRVSTWLDPTMRGLFQKRTWNHHRTYRAVPPKLGA